MSDIVQQANLFEKNKLSRNFSHIVAHVVTSDFILHACNFQLLSVCVQDWPFGNAWSSKVAFGKGRTFTEEASCRESGAFILWY